MKKIAFSILISLFFSLPAFSKTNVVVSYQYIEDILNKIGKDKIIVFSLSKGTSDPHFIVPKPSLISKARNADLLVINGGELEIGWIPPILNQANNPNIQSGSKGFLDLSNHIKLIEKMENFSRAYGDVHPNGNPHFILNPDNVIIISKLLTEKLSELDPINKDFYKKNNLDFTKKWNEKLSIWSNKMKNSKGKKVIQYHKLYNHFLEKYGLKSINTIELLPGINPTPKHISDVIKQIKDENVKIILQDVYHNQNSSKLVSDKSGIPYVLLPHDVGSLSNITDIFSLFDNIVDKISK